MNNLFPAAADVYGFQQISGSCSLGERVHLYSGNFLIEMTLIDVSTIGAPLNFKVTYNSLDPGAFNYSMGYKWRHNYLANLQFSGSPSVNYALYTSSSGRETGFNLVGTTWVLDNVGSPNNYYFITPTLAQETSPSTNYRLTYPDGSYYRFDSSGILINIVDRHGNTTSLSYTSGALTSITEPTGRSITLSYTSGYLTQITDPNGNSTTLAYDTTHQNLTSVTAPTSCVTSFGYSTPSNSLVTSKTDPRGNIYTYAYNGSNQLYTVTDAESPSHTITYTYYSRTSSGVREVIGFNPSAIYMNPTAGTILTDARGNTWEYRFDLSGMLWRVIDPLNHWTHYFWDGNQQLLSRTEGFRYMDGSNNALPGANCNNVYYRAVYDSKANLTYQADYNGIMDAFTYDGSNNMLTSYRGQADLRTQGNWPGVYGADGYILCSFDGTSSDVQSLPSYLAAMSPITFSGTLARASDAGSVGELEDPRAVVDATSLTRGLGYWKFPQSGTPKVTIALGQSKKFNLSVYTSALHMGPERYTAPLTYYEQTGNDIVYTVTDKNGTYTFEVGNNAQGTWVTFPVEGDGSHSITLTAAGAGTTDANIYALMFDPLENHKTTYTYNGTNDPLTVTDGLGNETTLAYDVSGNGLLTSITDPLSHQTSFTYGDTYKNLTAIQDANGNTTNLTYDSNGNILTVKDANGNNTTLVYDGKNRVTSKTDALGNVTTYVYNNNGDLYQVTDANNNTTEFLYTPSNRLWKLIDALTNTTVLAYDAAGNISSVTDPRSNVTSFTYDAAGNRTKTTLADSNIITAAYDALNRLRAITTQNGNQTTLANINVTNAANWLQNSGAENADLVSTSAPRYWSATPGANGTWDNTVSHSGSYSLKLATNNNTPAPNWSQSNITIPPGVTAMAQLWARPDGTAHASTLKVGAEVYNFDATVTSAAAISGSSSQTTLPASSTSWLETSPFVFAVPGDSQAGRFPMSSLQLSGSSSAGTPNAWYDDVALYSLSTAYRYDGNGYLLESVRPDGARRLRRTDRFGRITQFVDPRGNVWTAKYDALNRITTGTDSLGNSVTYVFDAAGRLTSFTDQKGNQTQYSYDAGNRLTTITYPDSTTEVFAYDAGNRMIAYTNNRSQQRAYGWDAANRLLSITYSDATVVRMVYDAASRLIWFVEADGTRIQYFYDVTNRLTHVERIPITSTAMTWVQKHNWDATSNETEYDRGATTPVYGTGVYNTDVYASSAAHWSVPSSYSAVNLMPSYKDRNNNQTSFSYDAESRVSGVTFPNGSPAVTTTPSYDVTGKLMSLATGSGSSSLLSLGYGYDQDSNRVAMTANSDSIDYRVDGAERLVEESINRMVEQDLSRFSLGQVNQVDVSSGALNLLSFGDTFSGNIINTDRWRIAESAYTFVGQEYRQNGALQFAFPKGYWNQVDDGQTPADSFGTTSNPSSVYLEHRTQLTGNFDVQIDLANFQANGTHGAVALLIHSGHVETTNTYVQVGADQTAHYWGVICKSGTNIVNDDTQGSVSTGTGKFRITRTGGNTMTLYYWNGSAWVNPTTPSAWSITDAAFSGNLYVSLYFTTTSGVASANLQNFVTNGPPNTYPSTGTYTSAIYDAGQSVTWNQVSWASSLPTGTSVQMDVQAGASQDGSFTITGTLTNGSATVSAVSAADLSKLAVGASIVHADFPGGTTVSTIGGSSFTASNNATANATATSITAGGAWSSFVGAYTTSPDLLSNISGRYFRCRATLNANGAGTSTPTISRVDAAFSGTTGSQVLAYSYDGSGNLISKTTDTTSIITGTITNGSATVSSVSGGDIAKVTVGAVVANANFPSGTTVSTVGGSSFTVSNNATANATGASIGVTGTSTTVRTYIITGTLSSGSSTVSSVSAGDLGKIAVGYTIQHADFPAGTYVVSKSSSSFVASNNATANASATSITTSSINDLNQLLRSDVTPAGGSTTTWTYTFDNSGNMLTKYDGTNTTTYTWDERNRLTQAALPGSVTITYTYDNAGRMLTRVKSGVAGTATYEWDGFDMVCETDAGGTVTRYYIPHGVLMSFERSGSTYQVHSDALGTVRAVTNSSGTVVFSATYDAWGNVLSVTDSVPNGGFMYRYVGALGCRYDSDTGLVYMRQRWYDPAAQRFISRDPVRAANLYAYSRNQPTRFIDPTGLCSPLANAATNAVFTALQTLAGGPTGPTGPTNIFEVFGGGYAEGSGPLGPVGAEVLYGGYASLTTNGDIVIGTTYMDGPIFTSSTGLSGSAGFMADATVGEPSQYYAGGQAGEGEGVGGFVGINGQGKPNTAGVDYAPIEVQSSPVTGWVFIPKTQQDTPWITIPFASWVGSAIHTIINSSTSTITVPRTPK